MRFQGAIFDVDGVLVNSLHSRAWREALREPRGRPHPLIFVTAASEIGAVPGRCFVAEHAVSGVQAAKAGGMAALGVARRGDEMVLRSAGADLVVRTGVPQR